MAITGRSGPLGRLARTDPVPERAADGDGHPDTSRVVALPGVLRTERRISTPAPLPGPLVPPDGVAWMPSEDVLLLAVDLPAMAAGQRRAAVAFAVEDRIAEPLEDVHVILGPQVEAGRGPWIVAVASHVAMERAGVAAGRRRLVPDCLALPVPEADAWSVRVEEGAEGAARALVRLPDGTGLALPTDVLAGTWHAAGSPSIDLYGGPLPHGMIARREAGQPPALEPGLARFDLRAGRHARRAAGMRRKIAALAVLVGVVIVLRLALLGADTVALGRIADARDAELSAALGPAGQGADLDTAIARAFAAGGSPSADGFLPILRATLAAISTEAGVVTVLDLSYSAADGRLALTFEAPDLATLQGLEAAFAQAGLGVDAGAASTADGAASARMTLSRAGT